MDNFTKDYTRTLDLVMLAIYCILGLAISAEKFPNFFYTQLVTGPRSILKSLNLFLPSLPS